MKNIISNFKKCHTLKIKSAIAINFISFKHTHEEPVMHSKSDIRKLMIYDKTDEVIEEHFESLEEHWMNIKLDWKHQWELVVLSLIVLSIILEMS